MNLLSVVLLTLVAAVPSDLINRAQNGNGTRIQHRKLNATALKHLEERLHINMTNRREWIKRIRSKSQRNMTAAQQKEIDEKLSKLPKITPEKPSGVETIGLGERNALEGISEYMVDGDMHYTDDQLKAYEDHMDDNLNNPSRKKRQVSTVFRKWTGNTLYYYFDPSASSKIIASVAAALQYLQENTCVTFIQSSTAQNRVRVYSGSGCFSYVGMNGGVQDLSLGSGCEGIGIAAHEFSHALGGQHTQMRYDRDNYITINQAVIDPNAFPSNFAKLSSSETVNLVPYEYGSVMHYSATAFVTSSNGVSMVAKDSRYQTTMGSTQISFYDLKNINDNYGCSAQCASSSTRCQNGGVVNPRNCGTCICPTGYGGALCDQRPAGCGETLTATSTWQSKLVSFGNSTDNTNVRPTFALCNHWITAPAGSKIVVKLTSLYNGQCNNGCPFNGVEIKLIDQQSTNPRICCNTSLNQEFTSNLNPTPVIGFNNYYYTSYTIQYKIADSTSPAAPAPSPSPSPSPSPNPSGCNDNANCAQWVQQGFCTNAFYTTAQKTQFCPNACNLCSAAPAPAPAPAPATCTDKNANCPGFVNNGFCSSTFYDQATKIATCAKSCNLC